MFYGDSVPRGVSDRCSLDLEVFPDEFVSVVGDMQEFWVPTSFGHISVTVCGDQDKPALVTYPDVGLNGKIANQLKPIQ